MATQAQIEANRKNAKKSTGPQTPDGKSITAQNATKHGLTAQKPLIPGEDPDQFAIFNESMLDQLAPQGPLETVLANRIITLTWQLNRAPRLQAAAFNFMLDDILFKPSDPEMQLGKAIEKDFAGNHVLEKLQNYEQRIESNLYKTIAQLEKIQLIRKKSQESQPEPQPTPPTKSANYEPQTTNSIPQNKPNKKTHAKRAAAIFNPHGSGGQKPEKTNPNSHTPKPSSAQIAPSTNYELKTTNSFEKTRVASKPHRDEDGNPISPSRQTSSDIITTKTSKT